MVETWNKTLAVKRVEAIEHVACLASKSRCYGKLQVEHLINDGQTQGVLSRNLTLPDKKKLKNSKTPSDVREKT